MNRRNNNTRITVHARVLRAIVSLALFAAFAAASGRLLADDNAGPVRLARFSAISGTVTWHYGDDSSWQPAVRNMPLRQGAQIWTSDASRAEVQFDDGSRLRLDSNTLVTLQTLYSDEQGEFTEVTISNGSLHVHLKNQYSIYQIDTPVTSLTASGPARMRVSTGDSAFIEVFSGKATAQGNGGSCTISGGQSLYLSDANAAYGVLDLPPPDEWDTYNAVRDARIDNPDRNQYLPADIALVSDDLERHGHWHRERQYGWVWAPTVTDPDWRPYSAGSWTWVEPFGWTWVSDETWGWAPYHYGSWIHADYGWAWVPGPANQYWCPGVVNFYRMGNGVAWVPLAPSEVRYPSTIALGFHSGAWNIFFSIGAAAVYYPGEGHDYCDARPWTSDYINHISYVRQGVGPTGYNGNGYSNGPGFVGVNARQGGGTFLNSLEMSGHGNYQPIRPAQASMYMSARTLGAPPLGQRPAMGPPDAKPNKNSMAPERQMGRRPAIPAGVDKRVIVRAPLPSTIRPTASAPTGQRFTTPDPARVRTQPAPRDGSGFTTPMRTGGSRPQPIVPTGGNPQPAPVRGNGGGSPQAAPNNNPPPVRNNPPADRTPAPAPPVQRTPPPAPPVQRNPAPVPQPERRPIGSNPQSGGNKKR